jgi:hypothetical protein
VAALAARDAEGVLRFLAVAEELEGDDPFPPELLRELGKLVPADWIGYSERDMIGRRCLLARESPPFEDVFGTYDHAAVAGIEHPLCVRHLQGQFEATRLSAVFQRRALKRTPFHHFVLEPLRIHDQLAVAIPAPLTHMKRFFFDRVDREFCDRDRLVLDRLQPHLGRLWRAA